jgi:hypothetical protein
MGWPVQEGTKVRCGSFQCDTGVRSLWWLQIREDDSNDWSFWSHGHRYERPRFLWWLHHSLGPSLKRWGRVSTWNSFTEGSWLKREPLLRSNDNPFFQKPGCMMEVLPIELFSSIHRTSLQRACWSSRCWRSTLCPYTWDYWSQKEIERTFKGWSICVEERQAFEMEGYRNLKDVCMEWRDGSTSWEPYLRSLNLTQSKYRCIPRFISPCMNRPLLVGTLYTQWDTRES